MARHPEASVLSVADRICDSCHKPVSSTDLACRHCGQLFEGVVRQRGTFLNDFFRLCLGACALSLPAFCVWVGLTAPKGWGDIAAFIVNQVFFIPWLTVMISSASLVWLTEERR